MSYNYLDVTEVAKLARKALKETFPGVKFSVRCSKYAGGSSMQIGWTDGPTDDQVKGVSGKFNGSYFDGMIDYKGSINHTLDGEVVSFGGDFVFTDRDHSDALVERAINSAYLYLEGNFKHDGIDKPTVEEFRNGSLGMVRLSGLHHHGGQDVQAEVYKALSNISLSEPQASATLARIKVTGDDGYSRYCGSGYDHRPAE